LGHSCYFSPAVSARASSMLAALAESVVADVPWFCKRLILLVDYIANRICRRGGHDVDSERLCRCCGEVRPHGSWEAARVGQFQSADSVTYLRKSRQWLTATGQFRGRPHLGEGVGRYGDALIRLGCAALRIE
jgi:hypothetical protein